MKSIYAAIIKVQGKVKTIGFDSVNPHFKSKYASLTAIVESLQVPMFENGLAAIHTVFDTEKGMTLKTTLIHESGESLDFSMPMILSKEDMQGLGSAVTYAKRYSLASIFNLVSDEDDDGNYVSKPLTKREAISTSPRAVEETKPAATARIKMPAIKTLSPDEFILEGLHKGKKLTELDYFELAGWADKAEAFLNKNTNPDMARTLVAARKILGMSAAKPFLNEEVENDVP